MCMLAIGWGLGNVWIHLLKLLRWWSTPMRGFACWKRKGLLYILNTALKNTVLMSGVPYGAAVSRASGSFQGRAKHFFLNMLCGTMAQNNRGTSAFLPQVWKGERMTLVWWHQCAIWCLMTSTDWGENVLWNNKIVIVMDIKVWSVFFYLNLKSLCTFRLKPWTVEETKVLLRLHSGKI